MIAPRGYAAAATALLALSGVSSFGECNCNDTPLESVLCGCSLVLAGFGRGARLYLVVTSARRGMECILGNESNPSALASLR